MEEIFRMITELGRVEEKILDILREGPKKNVELCLKLFNKANSSKRTMISQSCNLLIKKELIRKEGTQYIFIKDLEVISELRGDQHQKVVTVPNREKTKNWKKGDLIKLTNLRLEK